MDAAFIGTECIGSDKGNFQKTPWKHDVTCLDFVLVDLTKGTFQETP